MSLLMSAMPFDPFNSQSYSAALFDPQEHYLQPPAFSPASYAPTHPFPVDPRWFNSSISGHASAAPHQFSSMTHPDIIPPHTQTDLLSLSPSSTIAPIPPLSGSRNRQGSMSNRVHSLNPSSRRLQRQSTGTSTNISTNTHTASTSHRSRMARRATVSSSSSTAPLQSVLASPPPPPSTAYMHSPPLPSSSDDHETRAAKRRRTNDHKATTPLHLQPFSAVPEPPQLLTSVQPPHLTQIHGHGYATTPTWAGPPSADPLPLPLPPHGINPDHHGFVPWNVASLGYYGTETSGQQFTDHALSVNEASHSQPQAMPYPSPTVAGPAFFASTASPVLGTPVSAHFQPSKLETDPPQVKEEVADEALVHGPTEFPPRPYKDGKSPWTPTKQPGKIYGSRLEQMPAIEARLAKLEDDLDHYLDLRAAQALKNSQLPGLDFDQPSIEIKPLGPSRLFGGRIWPTALARRVRRTPRD